MTKPILSRAETEYNDLWIADNPILYLDRLMSDHGKYGRDYLCSVDTSRQGFTRFIYQLMEN